MRPQADSNSPFHRGDLGPGSIDRGGCLMQSVIILTVLIGLASLIPHMPGGPRTIQVLSMCSTLTLMAILLYNGQRRFRIIFGLSFLASAVAPLLVGVNRVPHGSAAAWFFYASSLAFLYCS
jgi:hypothetical protein